MKSTIRMVTLCFVLATTGLALVPLRAFAQEETTTRYVGTLGGGNRGCPLNSQAIQIDIKGIQVNGFWVETNGSKPRFAGEMAGSSFRIIRNASSGNQSSIARIILKPCAQERQVMAAEAALA